jgi:hypothetical protein
MRRDNACAKTGGTRYDQLPRPEQEAGAVRIRQPYRNGGKTLPIICRKRIQVRYALQVDAALRRDDLGRRHNIMTPRYRASIRHYLAVVLKRYVLSLSHLNDLHAFDFSKALARI